MKDRRALGQEMIKEYIASGKPQSDAGKRAADMGLAPGTPEYQAKVSEFKESSVILTPNSKLLTWLVRTWSCARKCLPDSLRPS